MKAFHLWLPSYLRRYRRRGPITDLLFCICDHFEPFQGTDKAGALARVRDWRLRYAPFQEQFRDADSVTPQHSFFYPIEQYDADVVEEIAQLCADGGGEIELHLHHRDDTAANLESTLEQAKERFAAHGALSRDRAGHIRYGFVHGNWALGDSHPEGKACGVKDELEVLRRTGCYADFTMPSAPDPTQTRKINSIYYSGLRGRKPHDSGEDARAGADVASPSRPMNYDAQNLLLVQGPLGLNWRWRKYGVFPRIENADLTGANPPTANRFHVWKSLGVHVRGRPEWVFVKLHTHGAHPRNAPMLLGPAMESFHRELTTALTRDAGIRLHYVSARELVNVVHAAEAGHSGNAGDYRQFRYQLPGGAHRSAQRVMEPSQSPVGK